jgi:hypothetical protein
MPNFSIRIALVAAGLLFAGVGFAMESERPYGDAEYGRGLAVRWCGSCHVVTADQQRSMLGAPPFTKIAQTANVTTATNNCFFIEASPSCSVIEGCQRCAELLTSVSTESSACLRVQPSYKLRAMRSAVGIRKNRGSACALRTMCKLARSPALDSRRAGLGAGLDAEPCNPALVPFMA